VYISILPFLQLLIIPTPNCLPVLKVFNELNARSIDDHPNILRQLHQNKWFMGILAFTAAMQVSSAQI
jgi:hypothetical protein